MAHNAHLKMIMSDIDARRELLAVGADADSLPMMAPKMQQVVMKLKDVDCRAANLLKQEMLSNGGEAAVAKWSSGFTKPVTDVLIMGTPRQYRRVLAKLRVQPFGLVGIGREISAVLDCSFLGRRPWSGHGDSEKRTLLMGILNVTPDSFTDDGLYRDVSAAIDHALDMVTGGADIIDVGGESTRPGAEPVSVAEESERVLPVISALRQESDVAISIDTMKAEVAKRALAAGAGIVNDVGGLLADPDMARVAAAANAAVIVMHMQGEPRTMQDDPSYDDLTADIAARLRLGADAALASGLRPEDIAIDPGFGFGKTPAQNLELIKRLREFASLGYAVALGTSRKSTIGKVLDSPTDDRLEGTCASVTAGILNGAQIIRAHDAREIARVCRMTDAILEGGDWIER